MNPRYKTGILFFGVAAPVIVILVIFGVLQGQKSRVSKEFNKREAITVANARGEMAAKGVKAQLATYRTRKEHWDTLLRRSDVGSVTGLLKEISSQYSGGEKFRQNEFKFIDSETGIGAASGQPSVTYNISLSGTFQVLQESLLALESKMPNLSLNQIEIAPQKNGQLLQAELSYSAWIN